MTYEELSISLERLQRFGGFFKKYDRVYKEILIKHLICPKISLKTYHDYSFGEILYYVQQVWNQSVQLLAESEQNNIGINLYFLYEETKEFYAEENLKKIIFSEYISGYTNPANFAEYDFESKKNIIVNIFEENKIKIKNICNTPEEIYISAMMNFPLDIDGFLKAAELKNNISQNIKRLIWLNNKIKNENISYTGDKIFEKLENLYQEAENYRKTYSAGKPIKLIILVEGATEEILLPVFSAAANINFAQNGVEIIPSGGKNQVARIYEEIKEELALPVFIILDSDAEKIAEDIKSDLRASDRLYVLSSGEFEDILPDDLICRAVNSFYGLTGSICSEEICSAERKTHTLCELWKLKGFGGFKKAEFARIIAANVKNNNDFSDEMQNIILNIREMLDSANKLE